MYRAISLHLVSLGVITSLGQVSPYPCLKPREPYAAKASEMIPAAGNIQKRALLTSTIRSFDITVTVYGFSFLTPGNSFDLEFKGQSSGEPVGQVTVYFPGPGEEAVYHFCLDAVDESISPGVDDSSDLFLKVDIEPNVCPCGQDLCFDPHLQGLRGQHVEWTGVDGGWYALVKDDEDDIQINVRTTAPMPEDFPGRQFITGVAVLSKEHSLVVEVKAPYTVDTQGCPANLSPCLADGGLGVYVDGELVDFFNGPANDVRLPGDIELSSTNLPVECREFGGRKVWARMQKDMLRGRRQLSVAKAFEKFEEWMLSFTHMVAPEHCAAFVADSDLSKVQSDQALLRIVTPTTVVRLSAGINHRRAGKTDRFGRDLPELDFWQMGVGVEGLSLEHTSLSGLLGGTSRVMVDSNGEEVMEGAGALSGYVEDYRVSGAEGMDFDLLHK